MKYLFGMILNTAITVCGIAGYFGYESAGNVFSFVAWLWLIPLSLCVALIIYAEINPDVKEKMQASLRKNGTTPKVQRRVNGTLLLACIVVSVMAGWFVTAVVWLVDAVLVTIIRQTSDEAQKETPVAAL